MVKSFLFIHLGFVGLLEKPFLSMSTKILIVKRIHKEVRPSYEKLLNPEYELSVITINDTTM